MYGMRQTDRRIWPARTELYDRIRDSLVRRLRPVCEHMDARAFEALISRATAIQIKFEARRRLDIHGLA
jgi:hypothetical protein